MIVARVADEHDKGWGLHTTPLNPDWMSIRGKRRCHGRVKNNVVRLQPAGPTVAVCEGIETGLAYHQLTGLPVWACLSAQNLALFHPDRFGLPKGTEVVIAADFDGAGLSGAETCKKQIERLYREEYEVRLDVPDVYGRDWNDML